MPYLDIHVRTPDSGDLVARSVLLPKSEDMGKDIRSLVFASIPEATDYTFREISKREMKERERLMLLGKLTGRANDYMNLQIRLDNITKGF